MEISDVRKRVLETVTRAKRAAAERRARADEAAHEYTAFLERVAVPLFRQLGNVLRAEGYPFNVMTPGDSVRLVSDRSPTDYIELFLDTSGEAPRVVGRTSRGRGSRVLQSEQPLADHGPVRDLGEDDVLRFVMEALTPFVER